MRTSVLHLVVLLALMSCGHPETLMTPTPPDAGDEPWTYPVTKFPLTEGNARSVSPCTVSETPACAPPWTPSAD